MSKFSHTRVTKLLNEWIDNEEFQSSELAKAMGITQPRFRTLKNGHRRATDAELKHFDQWAQEHHPELPSLQKVREEDPTDSLSPQHDHSDFQERSFGGMLKALRESIDYSQKDMADALDLTSKDTVKGWEAEKIKKGTSAKACPNANALEQIINLVYKNQSESPDSLLNKESEETFRKKWSELYQSAERRVSMGGVMRDVDPPSKKNGRNS